MLHRSTRIFYSGFDSKTVATPFEQMHLDSVYTFWWHLFRNCHGSIDEAEDSLLTCWQSRKRYFDGINLHNKIYMLENTPHQRLPTSKHDAIVSLHSSSRSHFKSVGLLGCTITLPLQSPWILYLIKIYIINISCFIILSSQRIT